MAGIQGGANIRKLDAQNEVEVNDYLSTIVADGNQIDVVINLSGLDPEAYNHGKSAMNVYLEQFLIPMKRDTGTQFDMVLTGI